MKQFTLNKSIPGFLASNGINPTEVLRRAGLPDDLFSRPSTKVDAEEYYRFVEIIAGYIRNGEDFVKLATENGLEKETPQVIGALCSRNIKEAVPRMAYYADMFLPILLETQDTPEGFRIELKPCKPEFTLPPAFSALHLLFLLNMFRNSTGLQIVPFEMNLGIEEWDAVEDYTGVKPSYDRSRNPYMTLSRKDAEAPFISTNDELWAKIEPELNQRLSELREGCDFADRVRAALLELLPSGRCKVEDVAERLHLSVRTIQRRLTEEGVKFQTILRDARVALDKGLDNLPDLKKADRAYLLGFNHIDSYRRAMAMK